MFPRVRFRVDLTRLLATLVLLFPALVSAAVTAPSAQPPSRHQRALQGVLDRVKERLGLDHPVELELVPADPFLISVEPPRARGGAFRVRVERGLLDVLTDEELEAALAHELGHVWVFTHHPFLQTELGANEIALRVVSREALIRVYEKVWRTRGAKGSLESFLGARVAVAGGGQ